MNARPNCRAALTTKRAMENYLHPEAIHEATGLEVAFGDHDDVPEVLARAHLARTSGARWEQIRQNTRRRLRVKMKILLNQEAAARMTPQRLPYDQPSGRGGRLKFSPADVLQALQSPAAPRERPVPPTPRRGRRPDWMQPGT